VSAVGCAISPWVILRLASTPTRQHRQAACRHSPRGTRTPTLVVAVLPTWLRLFIVLIQFTAAALIVEGAVTTASQLTSILALHLLLLVVFSIVIIMATSVHETGRPLPSSAEFGHEDERTCCAVLMYESTILEYHGTQSTRVLLPLAGMVLVRVRVRCCSRAPHLVLYRLMGASTKQARRPAQASRR
jgi:hypothetical protein